MKPRLIRQISLPRAAACLTCLLLCTVLAANEPPAEVLQIEESRIAAIASASKSFVAVFANEGNGGGSGVVISADGLALTNFHVAKPAGNHMKCGMNDGRLYDAVLVGLDPTGDIALIKLLGRSDFQAATFANSDQLRVGDWCFAVGNPFLLATDLQPSVSYGIVSGVHRCQYPAGTLLEYTDAVQTDASINPGNSGGPLFNSRGELIGIVGSGSFDKRGRVNVGVGYAISINQVKNFLGCLKAGRLVDHATLGATTSTDDQGRVLVNNILDTSAAFRRGLRYGDEIVRFGGRNVTSANGFKSALGTFPKGWNVPLTYRREGQEYEISVRLPGLLTPEELNDKATKAFAEEKPEAKPPPGEKREDKKPAAPADQPRNTGPSEEIKALLEPRPGYANFYFNKRERERVWQTLLKLESRFPERYTGTATAGGQIEISLADDVSTGKFPAGNVEFHNDRDVYEQLDPRGSGGLLATLHLLRELLREGPEQYGDVYYYGTKPLVLGEQQYDVLIATRNVAELHLWLDPISGRLRRVELFVDDESDPCELDFVSATDTHPAQINVRHADQLFGTLQAVPQESK